MEFATDRSRLTRWRAAVFAIFFASGLSIATWASRVPSIKIALDVDNAQIGLMLLVGGAASVVGLSLAPASMARIGARRGMLAAMLAYALGVALIGIGTDLVGGVPLVVIGLALWGFGNGNSDVIMNVEGAAIEKQYGKTLLPLFHAFFSFGTVAGAGIGFLAIAWGYNVLVHTLVMTVLVVAIALVAFANVPARAGALEEESDERTPWRERLHAAMAAWRDPRTYALGVILLGMAFAEGGANDWLPLAVVEGHGTDEALGAAALTVFSVAMTAGRALGGPLVDRFGRVLTLRILAMTAGAGLLLFIFAPNIPLVFVGAALWGLGASLGFPLGMSAAADDPVRAAATVSAIAIIGYIAFLAGPPILGIISEHIGLLPTLLIIVVLIVASGIASGAARPVAGSHVGEGSSRRRRAS